MNINLDEKPSKQDIINAIRVLTELQSETWKARNIEKKTAEAYSQQFCGSEFEEPCDDASKVLGEMYNQLGRVTMREFFNGSNR